MRSIKSRWAIAGLTSQIQYVIVNDDYPVEAERSTSNAVRVR